MYIENYTFMNIKFHRLMFGRKNAILQRNKIAQNVQQLFCILLLHHTVSRLSRDIIMDIYCCFFDRSLAATSSSKCACRHHLTPDEFD